MTLRDQLQRDLQEAMRARDERRKAALRMVLLNVQLAEAEGADLDDEDVLGLIQGEVKRLEEAYEMKQEAGREELAAVDAAEIEILREYLPEPLSREEIAERARAVIDEVGATSPAEMGKVMGRLMPQVRNRADGRTVSQIVRELLST
ncbi:MAG: GatB/YqeY domain-containing protein [Anaerolineae bacterium]